jgi:hypothetical protein
MMPAPPPPRPPDLVIVDLGHHDPECIEVIRRLQGWTVSRPPSRLRPGRLISGGVQQQLASQHHYPPPDYAVDRGSDSVTGTCHR